MADTEVINIKVPATLFMEIDEFTKKRYLSKGEFVRSSILRFLTSLGFVKPFSLRMRESREQINRRMKIETKEKFTPDKEIKALRRIRRYVWSRNGKNENSPG